MKASIAHVVKSCKSTGLFPGPAAEKGEPATFSVTGSPVSVSRLHGSAGDRTISGLIDVPGL